MTKLRQCSRTHGCPLRDLCQIQAGAPRWPPRLDGPTRSDPDHAALRIVPCAAAQSFHPSPWTVYRIGKQPASCHCPQPLQQRAVGRRRRLRVWKAIECPQTDSPHPFDYRVCLPKEGVVDANGRFGNSDTAKLAMPMMASSKPTGISRRPTPVIRLWPQLADRTRRRRRQVATLFAGVGEWQRAASGLGWDRIR